MQFQQEKSTDKIDLEKLYKDNDEWDAWRNARVGHEDLKDGINCPICKNKRIIFNWRKGDKDCVCTIQRNAFNKARSSGMDTNLTFENYMTDSSWQKEVKEIAQDYAKNPIGWFFIGGQSGAGKTHICTAICLELIKNNRNVKYFRWRLEATYLKMAMKDQDYRDSLEEIKNADVLYIDDLFKGTITDADVNLAYTILDFRGQNKLPTIISSELENDAIWKKDEAIGGRIHQLCVYGNRYPQNISGGEKNYRATLKGE